MEFILTKNGRKFCPTIAVERTISFCFLTYLIFMIFRVLNKFSLLRAIINSWCATALVSLRIYSIENTGHRHAEQLACQHMTSAEKYNQCHPTVTCLLSLTKVEISDRLAICRMVRGEHLPEISATV